MTVNALSGRTMVLQVDKATASFVTLPGQRSTTFTINGSSLDVTAKDDVSTASYYANALVRKLLDQAGPISMEIQATGIFTDSSMIGIVTAAAQKDISLNCKITMPGTSNKSADTFTGLFKPTQVQYTGVYNDAQQYSLTLQSSDVIVKTA